MTIGVSTFVSDWRVMVEPVHRDNEWNLIITNVRHDDEGTYQCQVNTEDHTTTKEPTSARSTPRTHDDEGTYQCQVNTKDDQSNFYNIDLHIKCQYSFSLGE